MSKTEWYTRSTWTLQDQAEFEERLRRSRSAYHKAQYLRVQAWHLHDTGPPELTAAALGLLDRIIRDYPDTSQLAWAHTQRAECLIDLGHASQALEAYTASLELQRRDRQWSDDAYLGYGELVLALQRTDLYDQVQTVLEDFGPNAVFPATLYRLAAIHALIEDYRGNIEEAHTWAARALDAAAKTESPFRYHRKLGLVRSLDPDVHERLKQLTS